MEITETRLELGRYIMEVKSIIPGSIKLPLPDQSNHRFVHTNHKTGNRTADVWDVFNAILYKQVQTGVSHRMGLLSST
jgi:hypothetical protein